MRGREKKGRKQKKERKKVIWETCLYGGWLEGMVLINAGGETPRPLEKLVFAVPVAKDTAKQGILPFY